MHLAEFSPGSATLSPSEPQPLHMLSGTGCHQRHIQPCIYSTPRDGPSAKHGVFAVNDAWDLGVGERSVLGSRETRISITVSPSQCL